MLDRPLQINNSCIQFVVTIQINELKFMTISQPGRKSNIMYCNWFSIMNASQHKDRTHDQRFDTSV